MKHPTRIAIAVVFLSSIVTGVSGWTLGCSCSGEAPASSSAAGETSPVETATAAVVPAAPPPAPPVVEEEDEVPLPIESEDEPDPSVSDEPAEEPEPAAEPAREGEPDEDEVGANAEPTQEEIEARYPLEAVAYQFITNVVARPERDAPVVGYLRRGARVRVSARVSGRGCSRGWHEVRGGGYVCPSRGVVVGERPDDWPGAPDPPDLESPLPYQYWSAVRDDLPEFRERPTEAQVAEAQAYIRRLRDREAAASGAEDTEDVPAESAGEAREEGAEAAVESEDSPSRGSTSDAAEADGDSPALPAGVRMFLQRGFIVSSTDTKGRWLRTARGRYVERQKMTRREAPSFQGVELGEELMLPVAFVTRGRSKALRTRPGHSLRFEVAGTLRRLSALPVLGSVARGERRYISIGRRLLATSNVLAIAEANDRPPEVGPRERWIDVDVSEQTLVAYEGDRPVFATLVSTGRSADGFATPTGTFRIRTKHVSATMDDPDGGAEAYSIEDVPWTMYFHESYALHAAFWHNNFGRERSHGCVNLSPADARWLFFWAGPELPPGWHGVRSTREHPGTVVVVHE